MRGRLSIAPLLQCSPHPFRRGRLHDLRSILGLEAGLLSQVVVKPPQDAVFVSLDTEIERVGLIDHVVEVGITTLCTREIRGVEPGAYVWNWARRMRHWHFVVNVTRSNRKRVGGSMFAESEVLSPEGTREAVLRVLREASLPTTEVPVPLDASSSSLQNSSPLHILLVGQSIATDIEALRRSPKLHLNLLNPIPIPIPNPTFSSPSQANPTITTIFDTQILARQLIIRPSALGPLARHLGVDPLFWHPDREDVKGTHNAGNDAAYAMIVLMLFGVRGPELEAGTRERREAEVVRERERKKKMKGGWLGRLAKWLGWWR